MAHLHRCWCDRQYRCEADHNKRVHVLSCFDPRDDCDPCPDLIIHGPRFVPGKGTFEFRTVVFPVIRGVIPGPLFPATEDSDG